MGKKSKLKKFLSVVLTVIVFIVAFILRALAYSGNTEIPLLVIGVTIPLVIFAILISLLRKSSIQKEVETYSSRKWYKKSRFIGSILLAVTMLLLSGTINAYTTSNLAIFITNLILFVLSLIMMFYPKQLSIIFIIFFIPKAVYELLYWNSSDPIGSIVLIGIYIACILLCTRILAVENLMRNEEAKTLGELWKTPKVSPTNNSKIWIGFIVVIVILLISGLAGAFYWFEYRPTKIKQDCSWTEYKPGEWREAYDSEYKKCIRRNGLLE